MKTVYITAASRTAVGTLGKSLKNVSAEELGSAIISSNIKILGESDPEKFPIQPKKHSFEFLRENAHLRARTKTMSSVFRIRSKISYHIHDFFYKKNFPEFLIFHILNSPKK